MNKELYKDFDFIQSAGYLSDEKENVNSQNEVNNLTDEEYSEQEGVSDEYSEQEGGDYTDEEYSEQEGGDYTDEEYSEQEGGDYTDEEYSEQEGGGITGRNYTRVNRVGAEVGSIVGEGMGRVRRNLSFKKTKHGKIVEEIATQSNMGTNFIDECSTKNEIINFGSGARKGSYFMGKSSHFNKLYNCMDKTVNSDCSFELVQLDEYYKLDRKGRWGNSMSYQKELINYSISEFIKEEVKSETEKYNSKDNRDGDKNPKIKDDIDLKVNEPENTRNLVGQYLNFCIQRRKDKQRVTKVGKVFSSISRIFDNISIEGGLEKYSKGNIERSIGKNYYHLDNDNLDKGRYNQNFMNGINRISKNNTLYYHGIEFEPKDDTNYVNVNLYYSFRLHNERLRRELCIFHLGDFWGSEDGTNSEGRIRRREGEAYNGQLNSNPRYIPRTKFFSNFGDTSPQEIGVKDNQKLGHLHKGFEKLHESLDTKFVGHLNFEKYIYGLKVSYKVSLAEVTKKFFSNSGALFYEKNLTKFTEQEVINKRKEFSKKLIRGHFKTVTYGEDDDGGPSSPVGLHEYSDSRRGRQSAPTGGNQYIFNTIEKSDDRFNIINETFGQKRLSEPDESTIFFAFTKNLEGKDFTLRIINNEIYELIVNPYYFDEQEKENIIQKPIIFNEGSQGEGNKLGDDPEVIEKNLPIDIEITLQESDFKKLITTTRIGSLSSDDDSSQSEDSDFGGSVKTFKLEMDQFQSDQVSISPEEATFNGIYTSDNVTVKGIHTAARSVGEGFHDKDLSVKGNITIESNEAKTIYCLFDLKQEDYETMPINLDLEFTDITDSNGNKANAPVSIEIKNINKNEIKPEPEVEE
jgi:hypothetical protein